MFCAQSGEATEAPDPPATLPPRRAAQHRFVALPACLRCIVCPSRCWRVLVHAAAFALPRFGCIAAWAIKMRQNCKARRPRRDLYHPDAYFMGLYCPHVTAGLFLLLTLSEGHRADHLAESAATRNERATSQASCQELGNAD